MTALFKRFLAANDFQNNNKTDFRVDITLMNVASWNICETIFRMVITHSTRISLILRGVSRHIKTRLIVCICMCFAERAKKSWATNRETVKYEHQEIHLSIINCDCRRFFALASNNDKLSVLQLSHLIKSFDNVYLETKGGYLLTQKVLLWWN